MNESLVDPIHYAWVRCNPGVPFPAALRLKNTAGSPLASSLSSVGRVPAAPPLSPEEAAARAKIHSRLLAGRRPRPVKREVPQRTHEDFERTLTSPG